MALNPGVKGVNVFTMMWVVFAVRLVLSFAVSFMTTLLIDDYGVNANQAGKVAGNLGFYASIASVMAELVMGSIMDTFGRKWASIIGMTLAGTALGLMPVGTYNVFPYLYALRIIQTVGLVPLINSPLWLDYVQHQSMGKMASWVNMIATVSAILATCGTLVL